MAGPCARIVRASFSITEQSLWALEILVEEGFRVDSSVFPIHHDRYGIPGARLGPHRLTTAAGGLWEFPPSVVRIAGMHLPVGGGGYFRLFPLCLDAPIVFAASTGGERQPFVFYVHPGNSIPNSPAFAPRGCRGFGTT